MSEIKNQIERVISLANNLPSSAASQAEIASVFDPTEHFRAQPVRKALDELIATLREFRSPEYDLVFDTLPKQVQKEIGGHLDRVASYIEETLSGIQKQEPSGVVPRRLSDAEVAKFANEIEKAEGELYKLLHPLEATAKSYLTNLDDALEKANEAQRKLAEQTAKATKSTENVAAAVLTKENVDQLDDAITQHANSAKKWLFTFICACVITIRLLVWVTAKNDNLAWPLPMTVELRTLPDNATLTQGIVYLFGKVILLSFALGICVLTVRTYQTHWHNVIVNRQRKIASISFLELYRAIDTSDSESKKELVKQAAQAIFAHTSTGFLHKGSNEFAPFAPIITEVLKTKIK